MRLHGRPTVTIEWTERHGDTDISAVGYTYLPPGLVFLVNRGTQKVFGLGAEMIGGWSECYRTILGGPVFGWKGAPIPAPATFELGIPLPPLGIRIVSPGPEIPPERASFSGKWLGRADGFSHILAVEEIQQNPPRVIVVYASANLYSSAWWRVKAMFHGSELRVNPFGSLQVLYRMRQNGTLEGSWSAGGHLIMERMKN